MDLTNERSVYKWTAAIELKEQRILALDAHDNVLTLGDKKGHVFPFEEQINVGQIGS